MSDPIDNPTQAAALDAALVKLDIAKLSEISNTLTGGCLRPEDAMKVTRMVALAAIRQPGKTVCVAGIRAEYNAGHLAVGYSREITDIEIPTGEEI